MLVHYRWMNSSIPMTFSFSLLHTRVHSLWNQINNCTWDLQYQSLQTLYQRVRKYYFAQNSARNKYLTYQSLDLRLPLTHHLCRILQSWIIMRNFYTSHVNIVVTFLREKGDNCHEIENRNWKIKYIGKNLIVNKVKINTCKHIVSLVKSFYFTKHIV